MISFTFLLHFFSRNWGKRLKVSIGQDSRQAKLALSLGAYVENTQKDTVLLLFALDTGNLSF